MPSRHWKELIPGIHYAAIVILFVGLTLFGGSVRHDAASQLAALIVATIAAALAAYAATAQDVAVIRRPLIFLGVCTMLCLLHLVPLPPELWLKLPGRAQFAEAAVIAGSAQPWRPLTLTPDFGWSSLTLAIPMLAAMLAVCGIEIRHLRKLLRLLIGLTLLSALLGLCQQLAGPQSALRFYVPTNPDAPVGFFANRNHYGLYLALALPLIAGWYRLERKDDRWRNARLGFAIFAAVAILFSVLLTSSRSATLIAVIGVALSIHIVRAGKTPLKARQIFKSRQAQTAAFGMTGAAGILMVALATKFSVFERFQQISVGDEARSQAVPTLIDLLWTYAPLGSGMGSFVNVFTVAEPHNLLDGGFMNHAHNEFFEVLIEAGFPGAILLILYLLWWVWKSIALFRPHSNPPETLILGRMGSVIIAMMLFASITDYPVRTPLIAALAALATVFVHVGAERRAATASAG